MINSDVNISRIRSIPACPCILVSFAKVKWRGRDLSLYITSPLLVTCNKLNVTKKGTLIYLSQNSEIHFKNNINVISGAVKEDKGHSVASLHLTADAVVLLILR